MSAGQTGQMTGQTGHVHGTDGTQTRGCAAKILYVYWFFSFPKTDLFSRVLFSFLPPLLATPLPPLIWAPFSPFSPPRKVLCSVEQRPQHTAWRGAVSGWTSSESSGRKFLPEICVKKGQKTFHKKKTRHFSMPDPQVKQTKITNLTVFWRAGNLSGPISRDTAILSLRYPISRDTF